MAGWPDGRMAEAISPSYQFWWHIPDNSGVKVVRIDRKAFARGQN
jgi:hypothetical protein